MQCVTLLLILVDTRLKELYLPMLVTGIHCTKLWVWKHVCQYQWSWDKPYSPGCNNLCPMLQFGSKHVYIEDVHIFKHCHEMTLFLLWIGTYCISCVDQQTSGVKDFSSLYDDSSLAAIRHVQSIMPIVRPRPNIRSHSVLFKFMSWNTMLVASDTVFALKCFRRHMLQEICSKCEMLPKVRKSA